MKRKDGVSIQYTKTNLFKGNHKFYKDIKEAKKLHEFLLRVRKRDLKFFNKILEYCLYSHKTSSELGKKRTGKVFTKAEIRQLNKYAILEKNSYVSASFSLFINSIAWVKNGDYHIVEDFLVTNIVVYKRYKENGKYDHVAKVRDVEFRVDEVVSLYNNIKNLYSLAKSEGGYYRMRDLLDTCHRGLGAYPKLDASPLKVLKTLHDFDYEDVNLFRLIKSLLVEVNLTHKFYLPVEIRFITKKGKRVEV